MLKIASNHFIMLQPAGPDTTARDSKCLCFPKCPS